MAHLRALAVLLLAVLAALHVAAPVAAASCSLSYGMFTYSDLEQNNILVTETLTFTPAGSYERTWETSFINNCGIWSYIAGGTYRTASDTALTLSQAYCVNRTYDERCTLTCPSNVETTYAYSFNADCSVLYITLPDDRQRYYYGTPQQVGLSGGAIFGIVFAVLLIVGAAAAGGYYYQRHQRRGYWSISNIPSEPTSKF